MNDFEPFVPLNLPPEFDSANIAKTMIRGILDSYHGEWDFLIESMQNAVDALDLKFSELKHTHEKPEIEVVINEKVGTIRVSDNGIGMDAEKAKLALYPNWTDKPYSRQGGKRSLRGHKGVGLSFLAYGFNFIKYCSKKDDELFSGEMSGGKAWVDSEDNTNPPQVKPSKYNPEFLQGRKSGTSVEILVGSDFFKFKNINWLGWHFIIRCLTAAGYCDINQLLPWNTKAKVTLKIINTNGTKVTPPDGYEDDMPLEYLYPGKLMKCCNLDEYHDKHPKRTELPKSEKGKYDALFVRWGTDKIESELFPKNKVSDKQSDGYDPYLFTKNNIPCVYAMFTHSASDFRELDQGYSNDKRRKFWKAGIQVITQQMPTGQMQEVSLTFGGGNKDRFFMLIELPDAKPDYGRKGFKSEVNTYVQFIAEKLLREYFVFNRNLLKPGSIRHGGTSVDAEATADERIDQVRGLPDLGVDFFNFQKEPQFESDVIALFCEMAARDIIMGFEILSVGSGTQYDGVVNYRYTKDAEKLAYNAKTNPLGIPKAHIAKKDLYGKNLEFKKSLIDLINDFAEDTKDPQKVRFVVTWDEGDMKGYDVINLLDDDNQEHREFHGQTHQLLLEHVTIPVIMLKYIIKLLRVSSK